MEDRVEQEQAQVKEKTREAIVIFGPSGCEEKEEEDSHGNDESRILTTIHS